MSGGKRKCWTKQSPQAKNTAVPITALSVLTGLAVVTVLANGVKQIDFTRSFAKNRK
jgi:hypothetical protein